MTVVHIVDVVAVLNRLVTAVGAVLMRMLLVLDVALEGALVPVAIVGAVDMAVVEVIGVVLVLDRYMAAVRAVLMGMCLVGFMGSCHAEEFTLGLHQCAIVQSACATRRRRRYEYSKPFDPRMLRKQRRSSCRSRSTGISRPCSPLWATLPGLRSSIYWHIRSSVRRT